MRLFKKKQSETEAIASFWQWWGGVRQDVAGAISDGSVSRFTASFIDHVEAIHEGMQWELTPGAEASHCLVVSPGGNAELRATAARWLAQAPPTDETWEYQSVRRADLSVFEAKMVMDGHELEMDKVRYGISVDREASQVHVQCYHPAFATMPKGMPEQIAMLSLDWVLGEEDVEIWIGEIGWTANEPESPRMPQDLRNAVASIAGDDQWVIMSGESRDGKPILATAAAPLRSARWPRFDLHVPVVVPYQRTTPELLPADESLQALRDFEDRLDAAIGPNGALVEHESSHGVRTLHYYVDSQTNAPAQIAKALPSWPEGRASTKPVRDPAFQNLRHLMQ
jgi:Family of unknown function (DUF695)